MALREPVPLVEPRELGHVHIMGVGGAGLSGIAGCYAALGLPVSGCDRGDSAALRDLAAQGVPVLIGHDPAHLDGVDALGAVETLVVSSAIREDNPELVAARAAGLRVWHRSAALGALMLGRRGVAVTGTHGKTTTSAMAVTALRGAGLDPSFVVGSPLTSTGRSFGIGRGGVFVVEADESDGSFLQYPAQVVVVTNIEADHLDNWGTPQRYAHGFERLVAQPGVRFLVADLDDPGAAALAAHAPAHVQVVGIGESAQAAVRLADESTTGVGARATLRYEGRAHELRLAVPGRHNLVDAAAAFAVGALLGADADALVEGLAGFAGTARRFQLVGQADGVRVYDDYAHHPTEIAATLTAARSAGGRLVVCFQPHLYTRTRDFADAFGRALALADEVVVTDVYAAREDPIPGVTGRLVADAAERAGARVSYVADKADLPRRLAQIARDADLVVTVGAGDVTEVGPQLVRLLAQRGGHG